MTDHQLVIVAVIGLGFLATLAAIFILVYLLAVDVLSRASESHHDGPQVTALHTHSASGTPRWTVTPTQGRDSLAGDNVRALASGRVGSHDMLASAWGHPAPRGVREVEASELPHQLWTGRLR